jgi:hypothetical protein
MITNISRWMVASINKHFDANKGSLNLYVGDDHRNLTDDEDYLELRIDGPYLKQCHKDYWQINLVINVLIVSVINDDDIYRIHNSVGTVIAAMTDIPIYKYGDDNSFIGCIILQQKGNEYIQVKHFGQLQPDVKVLQCTVEGQYQMYWSSE